MRASTNLLIEKLRECAGSGMTRQQAADAVGLKYQSVVKYAPEHDITFKRRRNRAPTDKRNREICDRYLAGEKQADLARELGITRERVRQIIEQAGIVSERKRHEDYVLMVVGTIARKAFTLSEACGYFGISRMSAWLYCRKHGVIPAQLSSDEIAELNAMAAEVENGKSLRQTAKCNGAKAEKLRRHLVRNGISARGRSRHDDMAVRRKIIDDCRADGMSWAEVAQKIAESDARPISTTAIYVWAHRHMPHLFEGVAA